MLQINVCEKVQSMQLRNRQRQIPNGIRFYIPQTKWVAPGGSFSTIVDAVIAHRKLNPWLKQSIDRTTVENEVDQFNANLCAQMGWHDYITGGDPSPPLPPAPSIGQRLAAVGAGAKVVVEWIASKEEAVPAEKANARAAVCAKCPMNEKGDLLSIFTVPATEAIRLALSQRSGWNLSTPDDYRLGVCNACDCPMRLKVHMPIDRIRSKLKPEQKARLHASCWIPTEQ